MKLWHISQTEVTGYDTFSDAVVAAQSEDAARDTYPGSYEDGGRQNYPDWLRAEDYYASGDWARTREAVKVEYLGEAADGIQAGIICASFHAG